ncbi:galactose mutarotase [Pseudooceanicola sp. CBS1P-1]|uniref:Galactose mutarotase n=1 Tax=Pseudooceanicola albus TaxID=2692189 RepID=A0A6L7G8D2_9RHOB|nr:MULTISPECIES: aldose epimerase family protein [Pseudooceanicola]MBT9382877.1 galactose mutarotase [Pseudooceanicola endophyticus]MXN20199.1 galactose mutarotase [Pseudooceanicola albus]
MTHVQTFGTLPSGEEVRVVEIGNGVLSARLLTHGARLQDLRLAGVAHPLVLGSDRLEDYLGPMAYFGATVGRYANRIGGAAFVLDGERYALDANEGGRTCLHGGSEGTGVCNWTLAEAGADMAAFTLDLPDGHMGFPGLFEARVTYRIEAAQLLVEMEAQCSADCPVSLAHHSYFSLDTAGDVAGTRLHVPASHYLAVDAAKIPLPGAPAPVAGTAFDFRVPRLFGASGIDHNYCFEEAEGVVRLMAIASGREGLSLVVESDAPGLQVYGADHLPIAGLPGLEGLSYGPRAGLALETQNWPDAPNRPDFPDAVLRSGATYRNVTRYGFRR